MAVCLCRATLPKLLSEAGSFASGRVRPDCMQGLIRLGALRQAQWGRVAEDLCLYPSAYQVGLHRHACVPRRASLILCLQAACICTLRPPAAACMQQIVRLSRARGKAAS